MQLKTQRDAFWDRVYELAIENPDIVVVSADMGAPALDKFRTRLSGQYVDVGIAEQQAVALSAGLALSGKKVFAYAIAPFITMRCFEQIRLDICAMNLPVTLVGVGAGFSYDDSGPTHHSVEDLSLLRTLPNMWINNITDSVMAEEVAGISCQYNSPNYVRMDRKTLPDIYTRGSYFTDGLQVLANRGAARHIIATGNMVHEAFRVCDILWRETGMDIGLIDLYRLPISEPLLLAIVSKDKALFTLEEHTLPGGMGSAVCEAVSGLGIPVKRFGLDFSHGYCYRYGGRRHLMELYGLEAETISQEIGKYVGDQDAG